MDNRVALMIWSIDSVNISLEEMDEAIGMGEPTDPREKGNNCISKYFLNEE